MLNVHCANRGACRVNIGSNMFMCKGYPSIDPLRSGPPMSGVPLFFFPSLPPLTE